MLLNLEKLTCSPSLVKLQKEKPLEVKGYSNLEVVKGKSKEEFLFRIIFEINDSDSTFATPLLQPEILTFFPLKSKLYKGNIVERLGIIKEIEINFSKVKYEKFKNLNDINVQSILADKFEFNPYTFYGFYEKIYIPSYVIGQYFYFPNTSTRRLFRSNNINSLVHKVDCQNGNIIFKQNVKFNEITAIIVYLFQCNKEFSEIFSHMYKYNIMKPLQKSKLEKRILKYLPTLFKFPNYQNKYKLLVRGEKVDDYFIVYEILNFDFTQIVNLDELKVSYKGKKQIKVFKTHLIASKFSKNRKNFSQIDEYNKDYLETNLSLLEIDSEIVKRNLKVKKNKPIEYNEYFSYFDKFYKSVENEGITLGTHGNKQSKYRKLNISIEKTDLNKIIKKLETELNIYVMRVVNKKDYVYICFKLTFNTGYSRDYLLIKLNRPNTAWYILSTDNPPIADEILAHHLIQIKNGKSEKYKNNNDFAKQILNSYQVCFHKSLKSNAESFESWINRLINRLFDWKNCKGSK